jgi:hypothetical protein
MRYTKLESVLSEEDGTIMYDLYLNPFCIESFYECHIEYTDPDGNQVERVGTIVTTKSGGEYTVAHPPSYIAEL